MNEKIRLLPLAAGSAAWNMAVDEALLEAGQHDAPILRFYEWADEAVSVGTAQRVRLDLRLDRIAERGIALVRRASGGTAIYHQHQVGVSLTVPNEHGLNRRDITESYLPFARALSDAFASLGIDVAPISLAAARRVRPHGPIIRCCLAGANPYEPFAGTKKVAGLAQVRRRDYSLIHAVVPLRFDLEACAQLLRCDPWTEAEFAEELSAAVTGLDVLAGRRIMPGELCGAISVAFVGAGFELETAELTAEENQLAQRLYHERYSQTSWTYRL